MTEQANSTTLYIRLLGYVRRYWSLFVVAVAAMVVLGLTEAGIPALLKPVLDGTFVEQDPTYLKWAPLAVVALFLVRGIARISSSAAFSAITTRLVYDLRMEMFDRLLTLPTRYYDANPSGTVIAKLVYNVSRVTQAGSEVLTTLVKDTVTVIALLVYLFWLDWKLSLFTLILGPSVAFVAYVMGRRIRGLSRRLQTSFGDLTHVLEEATRGHKEVKTFGAQAYEMSRFGAIAKRIRHLQFKNEVAGNVGVPVVELIGAMILAAVIYIGTNRAVDEQLTVGGFVAFFTALGLLFSPIKRLTKMNDPLQRGLAAAETIFDMIDEQQEQDKGTFSKPVADGAIRFEQVRVRYPNTERDALGPIDLTIEARTTTALVGASGSGKTTLANLVPRLHQATHGHVYLDGVDLQDWRLADLRRQIAIVNQDVLLFNDTIARNIAYGGEVDIERTRHAAKAAGALSFIEAMPEGLDTEIGENGVRLSGGQRQRIAIARALYADKPVLIFDEATSALDSESEQIVQAGLETLRKGRTTLVIAHRLSTIRDADQILVFDQGKIVEQGRHEELLQLKGRYAALIQAQQHPADKSAR